MTRPISRLPHVWRIPAIVAALVLPTFTTLLYFHWLKGTATWLQQGAYVAGKILQFGFPLAFAWWIEQWRPSREHLALPVKPLQIAGRSIGVLPFSLLLGLCQAAVLLVVYRYWLEPRGDAVALADAVREKVTDLGVSGRSSYLVLSLFYCVVHSFFEEYYWRWFVYGQLRTVCREPAANLISSLGFMAHHVVVLGVYFGAGSWNTLLGSLGVAVAGSVWAWLYERSGSLWGPWLAHLIADAGIFAIGYHLLTWPT